MIRISIIIIIIVIIISIYLPYARNSIGHNLGFYITCSSATVEVSVMLTPGWRERRSAEGVAMRRTAPTSAGGAGAGSPRRCLALATTAAPLFGWPGADRKEACGRGLTACARVQKTSLPGSGRSLTAMCLQKWRRPLQKAAMATTGPNLLPVLFLGLIVMIIVYLAPKPYSKS